jgi:hypothetical protein
MNRKQLLQTALVLVGATGILSLLVWPMQWYELYIGASSLLISFFGWLETNLMLLVEILGVLLLPAIINWGIQPLFAPLIVDTETKQLFCYNLKQTLFATAEDLAESEYCLRSRLVLTVKPPLIMITRKVTYLLPGRLAIRKIDSHTSSVRTECSKHDENWALGLDIGVSGFRLSRCKVDVVCDEIAAPEVVVEIGEPTFSGSGFEATRTIVVTNIESFPVRGYVTRIDLSEGEKNLSKRQVLVDRQPVAVDRVVEKVDHIRILLDLERLERKALTVHFMSDTV